MIENSTVMEVANDLLAIIRRDGFDPTTVRKEITAAVQPFVTSHEELEKLYFEHGIMRPEPPDRSRMLFYSPELLFMLSRYGPDFRLPTHNHESWNVLLICRGEMHFRWYRRLDDRTVPGRARIEIVDDLMVRTGEVAFVAKPPHDIHQLEVTQEGTWMLTVQPCHEPPQREIYDAEEGTYEMMSLRDARERLAALV